MSYKLQSHYMKNTKKKIFNKLRNLLLKNRLIRLLKLMGIRFVMISVKVDLLRLLRLKMKMAIDLL